MKKGIVISIVAIAVLATGAFTVKSFFMDSEINLVTPEVTQDDAKGKNDNKNDFVENNIIEEEESIVSELKELELDKFKEKYALNNDYAKSDEVLKSYKDYGVYKTGVENPYAIKVYYDDEYLDSMFYPTTVEKEDVIEDEK